VIQYKLTATGKHALQTGDKLIYLINEIAKDGVVSSEELMKYGFSEDEANVLIKLLLRTHLIEVTLSPADKAKIRYNAQGGYIV